MRAELLSFNELFPWFVAAKTAEGVSEKTVENYHQHWKCIGKHLDLDRIIDEVMQDDINNEENRFSVPVLSAPSEYETVFELGHFTMSEQGGKQLLQQLPKGPEFLRIRIPIL